MQNLYWGIVTVFCCAASLHFAYQCYKKHHIHASLLFVVLCGLLLRIYTLQMRICIAGMSAIMPWWQKI